MIDEPFFMAIKYLMVSENEDVYDRLKRNFNHPSIASEQTLKGLRTEVDEELREVSDCLEEIRGKLIQRRIVQNLS